MKTVLKVKNCCHDWVIIKSVMATETKTAGGIILAATTNEVDEGVVVKSGPDSKLQFGDKVVIRKGVGLVFDKDHPEYRTFRDLPNDVLMVL